jgi:hypothetical protein
MESTPYMDAVTAQRAMLLDEEQSLEGLTTISLETQSELVADNFSIQFKSNFPLVMKALRLLPKEDQELILSYYCLGKTQSQLALIHRTTQTLCSTDIRHAVQQVGCYLLFNGVPTEKQMRKVFTRAGVEGRLKNGLAWMVARYAKCHSYQTIAYMSGEHRPQVRRVMVDTGNELALREEPKERSLGAYIQALTEKASAGGSGLSRRKLLRLGNMVRVDSPILGAFHIDVSHPGFNELFAPQATL